MSATAKAGSEPQAQRVPCGSNATLVVALRERSTSGRFRVRSINPSSVFAVEGPNEGTTEPGAAAQIVIRAKPCSLYLPGRPVFGVLDIEVDGVEERYEVSFVPRGVYLTASDDVVDYGIAELGALRQRNLVLTNYGDEDARVSFHGGGAPFRFARDLVVPGGESRTVAMAFEPRSAAAFEQRVQLTAEGPVCALQEELTLRGAAFGKGIGIDQSVVEFAETDCNESAGRRIVSVTSLLERPIAWSARLGRGVSSPFRITPPAAGVAHPEQAGRIELEALPPGDTNDPTDELIIDTADGERRVRLVQRVRAPLLSIVNAGLDFPRTRLVGAPPSKVVTVENRGTVAAMVDFIPGDLHAEKVTVPPQGKADLAVSFTPTDVGPRDVTVQLRSVPPGCGPVAALRVRGQGFARATGMSASRSGVCFLIDGGQVACSSHPIQDPPHVVGGHAATALHHISEPTGICLTDAAGQRCLGPSAAGGYASMGALPATVTGGAASFFRAKSGAVFTIAANQAGTGPTFLPSIVTRALRGDTMSQDVVVVLGDGTVETWQNMGAGALAYPPLRYPWAGVAGAVDAHGTRGKGCVLLDTETVTCGNVPGAPQAPAALPHGKVSALAMTWGGWGAYAPSVCTVHAQVARCWGGTAPLKGDPLAVPAAIDIGATTRHYWVLLADGRVITFGDLADESSPTPTVLPGFE